MPKPKISDIPPEIKARLALSLFARRNNERKRRAKKLQDRQEAKEIAAAERAAERRRKTIKYNEKALADIEAFASPLAVERVAQIMADPNIRGVIRVKATDLMLRLAKIPIPDDDWNNPDGE